MKLDRRTFLWAGGAAALAASIAALRSTSGGEPPAAGRPMLVAPERGGNGSFGLGILDLREGTVRRVALPFLAHSLVQDPGAPHLVVACAQRPGRHSMLVDIVKREVTQTFDSGDDRHFYGHGVFSEDGSRFYATENRYDDGAGVIVVRATTDFREEGLIESHGVGPHELLPFGDGRVVIAHGGARTDPRTDELVSKGPLESSLTVTELATGKLVESAKLGDPTLSIRHLATDADGTVVCALKRYGASGQAPTTVAFWRPGGAIALGRCTDRERTAQGALALSVTVEKSSGTAVVTHPTTDAVSLWSVAERRQVGTVSVRQPEGVAIGPGRGEVWVTSRTGETSVLNVEAQSITPMPGIRGLDWKHSMWINVPV